MVPIGFQKSRVHPESETRSNAAYYCDSVGAVSDSDRLSPSQVSRDFTESKLGNASLGSIY